MFRYTLHTDSSYLEFGPHVATVSLRLVDCGGFKNLHCESY